MKELQMLEQKLNNESAADDSASAHLRKTDCYKQPGLELYHEDCLATLKRIEDGSVDLLLQDTPFGCTQNKWDIKPNFPVMWQEWERVIKDNGAMIFFGTQPFVCDLISSRAGFFRYDLIWEKDRATGFLNAAKMPLRCHEHILIFYKQLPVYNPQKSFGHKPANASKKNCGSSPNYGDYKKKETGGNTDRFPRSVIYENVINALHEPIHPTQKPIDLMRYLIRTYSNKYDLVFDGYSGSGTTAAACIKEKRHFIGSELDEDYFDLSVKRLEEIRAQPELW